MLTHLLLIIYPPYHCIHALLYWLSVMQEMYWHNSLLIVKPIIIIVLMLCCIGCRHARDIPAHFSVDYLPPYHCTFTLLYRLSGMQEMYWHNLLLIIINLLSLYSCLLYWLSLLLLSECSVGSGQAYTLSYLCCKCVEVAVVVGSGVSETGSGERGLHEFTTHSFLSPR